MASDLISKLLAAGLSAGVFLIWWPEHHATAGLASLVVRGALWTLTYELLLVAFTPLERLARRAVAARAHRLRPSNPFAAVPGPARVGGACVLACAGAALPLTLLAGAHAPRPVRAAATATTKRVVVVRRAVVKRVVVRETVTVPAVVAHPSPPVVVRARATDAPRRATKRAATRTTSPKPAPTPDPPASSAPATTPAPVAPTTTPDPADQEQAG